MFTRADLLGVWVGIEMVVAVSIAWIGVLVLVVVLLAFVSIAPFLSTCDTMSKFLVDACLWQFADFAVLL